MNKKWNGYLTVEASFLMPMVLFLYMLVILCGFYLYNRCVISQDNYLLAFRGSRFTDAAENYGEVIYGETEETDPDESYLKSRMAQRRLFILSADYRSRGWHTTRAGYRYRRRDIRGRLL